MKYILLITIMFSVNAVADECPADNEVVVTTPYKLSKICPAATIIIEGERNPEKYESCLGDVPSASEKTSYQGKDKKIVPLPTINSLLPPDTPIQNFKSRIWIVGTGGDDNNPDIKCDGNNGVLVGYWGGGNCRGCAREVKYTFDNGGKFKDAKFK